MRRSAAAFTGARQVSALGQQTAVKCTVNANDPQGANRLNPAAGRATDGFFAVTVNRASRKQTARMVEFRPGVYYAPDLATVPRPAATPRKAMNGNQARGPMSPRCGERISSHAIPRTAP